MKFNVKGMNFVLKVVKGNFLQECTWRHSFLLLWEVIRVPYTVQWEKKCVSHLYCTSK